MGREDSTNVSRKQKVTNADGFKHLLRYYDGEERGAQYRFPTHSRFPQWAQNMLQRHHLLSQASVSPSITKAMQHSPLMISRQCCEAGLSKLLHS